MHLTLILFLFLQAPQAPTAKPLPASFKTFEEYIDALVDWKISHPVKPATRVVTAVTPKTLAACKKQLTAGISQAEETDKAIADLKAENARLVAANAEQDKKFAELKTAAVNVYTYATGIEVEYKRLVSEHEKTVENFNAVLTNANAQIELANNRLNRQNQINNALAIYSLMPKYQPITIAPLPSPIRVQANCTSTTIGQSTNTNCY